METSPVTEVSPTTQAEWIRRSRDKSVPVMHSYLRQTIAQQLDLAEGKNRHLLNVLPQKDISQRQTRLYRVIRVVSPFEFYLRLVMENFIPSYDNWFEEMQTFYAKRGVAERYHLDHRIPVKGRCYVVRDKKPDLWHRCRVYDIDEEIRSANVFYCDLGKMGWVSMKDLLEIDPEFTVVGAQFYRAYLYDICPIGKTLSWSEDACAAFKDLVLGKEFVGAVFIRSDNVVRYGFPEFYINIGVVLLDYNKLPAEGEQKSTKRICTINSQMVELGFARPIGIFAGCDHGMQTPGMVPNFTEDDFNKVVAEEAQEAGAANANGAVAEITSIISRTILTDVDMRRIMSTSDEVFSARPNLIWKANSEVYDNHYANSCRTVDDNLPSTLSEHLSSIKITYVNGPNFIVVQLKSQLEDFKRMGLAIKTLVQSQPLFPLRKVEEGEFIVADFEDTTSMKKSMIWCRCVVLEKCEDKLKVLLVDYGNEIYIDQSHCRRMPAVFEKIPSFAVRVHLAIRNLLPNGPNGWTEEARDFFSGYINFWDPKNPNYYMFRMGDPLQLNVYRHFVVYKSVDPGKQKDWVPRLTRSNRLEKNLSQMPILASLYRSIPVDIRYQVSYSDDSPAWYFTSVADSLLHRGWASFNVKEKSKDQLHVDIVELLNHSTLAKERGTESFEIACQSSRQGHKSKN